MQHGVVLTASSRENLKPRPQLSRSRIEPVNIPPTTLVAEDVPPPLPPKPPAKPPQLPPRPPPGAYSSRLAAANQHNEEQQRRHPHEATSTYVLQSSAHRQPLNPSRMIPGLADIQYNSDDALYNWAKWNRNAYENLDDIAAADDEVTDVSADVPSLLSVDEAVSHIRHVSPLPSTLQDTTNCFDSSARQYKAEAFKFYIERHFDNLLRERKARDARVDELEKEMRVRNLSDEAKSNLRLALAKCEANYLRSKREKLNVEMFRCLEILGSGAYGQVKLVERNGKHYAMKVQKKEHIMLKNSMKHVKAECDVLSEADCDWIVKLFYSFQDDDNIYFVMEYVPGGDLMNLLMRKGVFSEEMTRFYVAEMSLAIAYIHHMGFIHRDIKPDNILIDKNGHLKLTDFGLCTGRRDIDDLYDFHRVPTSIDCSLPQQLSLVGTENYTAPEVLRGEKYDELVDWWSMGIVMYECIVGHLPFIQSPTGVAVREQIIYFEKYLNLPMSLSHSARSLINGLIQHNQSRLSSDLIHSHPFFEGVDWSNIRHDVAPFVPEIKSITDVSHFDTNYKDPPPITVANNGAGGEDYANVFFDLQSVRRIFDT